MNGRPVVSIAVVAGAWALAGAVAVPTAAVVLDDAVARIGELDGIRTIQVWRGDELLVERTFRGAALGAHDVKSASKSVVSALVGIALERGLLPGLDAELAALLPDEAARLDDRGKRSISLGDLLSMSSGLASTSGPAYGAWVSSSDWVRAALARPLEHPPGTRFAYSTGNSHLVAAALSRACSCDLLEWGREVLFGPLGIEVVGWDRDPRGIRFGGNSFLVAPADFAKLGRLYLAGGKWQGRQLVPAEWIERSTGRHSDGWPERYGPYGLLWWLPTLASDERSFAAIGFGGQYLIVSPGHDAVVMITATHVGKGAPWDRELLSIVDRELLPATRRSRRGGEGRDESRGRSPGPGAAVSR